MAAEESQGGLQIDQDLGWQRREWVVERVGWVVMAAICVAALVGLFGPGLLGSSTASSSGGAVSVSYPRIGRASAPFNIDVTLSEEPDESGRVTLWLGRAYLDQVALERVTPEPAETRVDGERMYFEFDVGEGGGKLTIQFAMEFERMGIHRAEFGLEGSESVSISQLAYP